MLSAETQIERLVYRAKLRWLIERDYLKLKQELGLLHYARLASKLPRCPCCNAIMIEN